MRTTCFQFLTAAVLAVALPGAVATANEYYGDDGGCYGDEACYGDCGGACYGGNDGGCYGNGCGGRHGGGGLFGHHGSGRGHKGPCYWCGGGPCLGGGACCCYGNCGCGDCGYMLPLRRAQWYNWNRNYAYTDYGQTTALVVPPTANLQTNYGWGVASSRLSRIDHQFQRNYPGGGPFGGSPYGGGGGVRPTPRWPSDTSQFGVYYVRGPW